MKHSIGSILLQSKEVVNPFKNIKKGRVKMDKLFNWLFQCTPDGATYLQVIIIGGLLFWAIGGIFVTMSDVLDEIRMEKENEKTETNIE